MLLREFLLLATAHWLALASPGPDFFLLLRNALRHGRYHGIGTSLGIACANGFYIILALAGFSMLQHSALVLVSMKLLVAAYLGYLGWGSLRSRQSGGATGVLVNTAPPAHLRGGFWSGFGSGVLSGGLNPKNALFYLGLFTLMVDAATGLMVKTLYGVWMFAAVFIWDAALVLLISDARVAARLARYLTRVEWCAGAVLLLAALAIAVSTVAGIGAPSLAQAAS